MIVADTNVLSEPLRSRPEPRVLAWLAEHRRELAVTAVTVGELRFGAASLAPGRRRAELEGAIERLVASAGDRVLGYDERAAGQYAKLRAAREASGHRVSVEDAMIAGICLATGAELATRNVRDFADTGVVLHNPWQE